MAPVNLDILLDMGFDRVRAELAAQQPGGIQAAISWLEQNQDRNLESISSSIIVDETNPASQTPPLSLGEEARSLICNECGKIFKCYAQAEFHASKTAHIDFAESAQDVAPLTDEEKKARLEELRKRLVEKRASTSEQDRIDQKRNEEIRRKSTKEAQDMKEDLKKRDQLKEAAVKRREKQEEIVAKERIRARILADKTERQLKAEKERVKREGQVPPQKAEVSVAATNTGLTASKAAVSYSEARLRLQIPGGNIQKIFPADATLFEVATALRAESGVDALSFTQNFPKKIFDNVDFGATLRELGLVPSASLIVQ